MTCQAPVEARTDPFPHAVSASFLDPSLAEQVLDWLETEAPWKLRIADFYEQHEFELSEDTLPARLEGLIAPEALESYIESMVAPIAPGNVRLVEATAHRLSGGQTIRIHNDYIGGEETHRLLVQLNRNWADENGGFLMLFSSSNANDVARIIRPVHGSAVAFEISPASYHAVSPTVRGERYTLVFSFRRED
ncbi:MAG TPA: cyclophane-containing peptide 2OG-Fe(II) oxygenase YhhC [Allosphingosinicella sp.]|nr:cyclophane-containing peptide 2OG-Fe(II) oxygenase YhhC [Allosphingosinicella sp.]